MDKPTVLPYTREERTLIAELLVVDEPLERGSNLYKRWGAMMDRHRSVASSCWHAAQMLLETEQSVSQLCECDHERSLHDLKDGCTGMLDAERECLCTDFEPPVQAQPQDDHVTETAIEDAMVVYNKASTHPSSRGGIRAVLEFYRKPILQASNDMIAKIVDAVASCGSCAKEYGCDFGIYKDEAAEKVREILK